MKTLLRLLLVVAGLALCTRALAQCAPGTSWQRTWTDSYGETTYRIEAPCKVFVGTPFDVVLTVTDAAHPTTSVGATWSILDNGARVAGGGLNWITTDATGRWTFTLTQTYPTLVVNHTIQFDFKDLGDGEGAHGYASSLIGALTVDPYPNTAPVADAGPDLVVAAADLVTASVAGSASDDEGDTLTYRWLEGDLELQASGPVDGTGAAPLAAGALVGLPPGAHVLTLEVSDGVALGTDAVTVTLESTPDPAADPTPHAADPAGGCASGGLDASPLAALAAVAAVALRRRRRLAAR
jgi:uncharacterized protein (TIGR03382 family)